MDTDWIAQLNSWFDEHDHYPTLEAVEVVGRPSVWLLVDEQEQTGYRAPEGCYRTLTLLKDDADFEDIFDALQGYCLDDDEQSQIEYQPDGGYLWIG